MAEVLGIVSGIAGLISLAMEVTKLSYVYITDIREAHSTQKQYLQEMSALTEVLLRSEEAAQAFESQPTAKSRPPPLSNGTIRDCAKALQDLRVGLEKPSSSLLWPFKEKTLRKHIEELHRFRSTFTGFLTAQTLVTASATHSKVARLGQRQDQKDLLDWIGSLTETSVPRSTLVPGTGEWFLRSDAYRNWVAGNGQSMLWCHGPPGVGKSMLASLAVQNLSETLQGGSTCLLYYFCDFASRKAQKKETIWRSLLRQAIMQGQASVLQHVADVRERLGMMRPPAAKELSDALLAVCVHQQVVLIIDGPDELESPKDIKAILSPFMKANSRILVMSRDIPEICRVLSMAEILEIQADKGDLRAYVTSQFEENDLEELLEDHPDLETNIIDKSNGIFLLETILVSHLLELSTIKEMRKALQSSPIHLEQAFESSLNRINAQSKSHSALANRVIGWIISAERKLLVSELIHGLATEEGVNDIDTENVVASRTVLKVCGGLVVINPRDGTFTMVHTSVYEWFRNRESTQFHEDLARSCLRYLTMRPLSEGPAPTVQALEGRIKSLPFLPYAAQYWQKHILDDGMEANLIDAIDSLLDNVNLRLAVFQVCNFKNNVEDLAIRSATFESMPTSHSALHIAAHWNLPGKVLKLLANGEALNEADSQNWTPLHWACFGGSRKAVSVLVSHGANIEAKDSVGWTPLFWTALNGDTSTAALLLENSADYIVRDIHGWNALRWAVARQHPGVIQVFLKHHSDRVASFHKANNTNPKIIKVQEALRYTTRGIFRTAQHMIPKKMKTRKALYHASQAQGPETNSLDQLVGETSEFDDLYTVLQDETHDINQLWNVGYFDAPVGNIWRTINKANIMNDIHYYIEPRSRSSSESLQAWRSGLLYAAIRDNKLLAVKLLINLGVELNNHDIRNPLHAAAFRLDPSFAEVLVDHGAEIEALDYQGFTPLQQAVLNGFEETSKLLLAKGANVNAVVGYSTKKLRRSRDSIRSYSSSPKTPLMLACGLSEDEELRINMVRMLLDCGADPNMRNTGEDGMSALHYAARSRDPRLLSMMIEASPDSKMTDNFGRTLVHHLILGNNGPGREVIQMDAVCNLPSGPVTQCLSLLHEKCGIEYLSQTAKWSQAYRTSYSTWNIDKNVYSPLALAVAVEDWELFQALQHIRARFETNVHLDALLLGPVLALHSEAVIILVEHGAKFPSDYGRWLGDIYALSSSYKIKSSDIQRLVRILKALIPRGLDIDALNQDGHTLLGMGAAELGSAELVTELLELGADPCKQNGDGLDTILAARIAGRVEILQSLLAHTKRNPCENHWTQYFDFSKTTEDASSLPQICAALKTASDIDIMYRSGTILCIAVFSDDTAFVSELLRAGADPSLTNEKGQNPLHLAAEHGHDSITSLLLGSIDVDINAVDSKQRTALHLASFGGHSPVVEKLLSYSANSHIADAEGWTALHFAAWMGHADAVRVLLNAGASACAVTRQYTSEGEFRRPFGLSPGDHWTGTPLHLAAMAGSSEIVRLLLLSLPQSTKAAGIEKDRKVVNMRTDDFEPRADRVCPPTPSGGPTALHIALDRGSFYRRRGSALNQERLEIAQMLVESGARVDGVADHLGLGDMKAFDGFEKLWEALRGVSEGTEANV